MIRSYLLDVLLSLISANFFGGYRLRWGLVVSSTSSGGVELIEDKNGSAVSLGIGSSGGEDGIGSYNVMVEERLELCFASCAGCIVQAFFEGVEGLLNSSN